MYQFTDVFRDNNWLHVHQHSDDYVTCWLFTQPLSHILGLIDGYNESSRQREELLYSLRDVSSSLCLQICKQGFVRRLCCLLSFLHVLVHPCIPLCIQTHCSFHSGWKTVNYNGKTMTLKWWDQYIVTEVLQNRKVQNPFFITEQSVLITERERTMEWIESTSLYETFSLSTMKKWLNAS